LGQGDAWRWSAVVVVGALDGRGSAGGRDGDGGGRKVEVNQ
jgi:hypothetical protein